MSQVIPFIRCDNNASQLADFYLSVFVGSKLCEQNPIVTTVEIFGRMMGFINGGAHVQPNPSISFSLWIKDKDQCDQLWQQLSTGGSVLMEYQAYDRSPAYGRCNDKYGVSRQVMYDNCTDPGHETNQLIPSLMFTGSNNGACKEAMTYYCSIFPDSKIDFTRPYGSNAMGENQNHISHAEFKLMGQQFIAMDSGADHRFGFDDGVSLLIQCDGQAEVDTYWESLTSDGGQESQCGRCKDKYGLSRQVAPIQCQQAIFHADSQEAKDRAMQAMLKMKKIVIKDLYSPQAL